MSIHTENSKRIDRHGIFCAALKRKCHCLKNEHLQELMHGKIILSPNKKIITNAIRQNEIIDEELLRKANNNFFTPNEFNMLSRI